MNIYATWLPRKKLSPHKEEVVIQLDWQHVENSLCNFCEGSKRHQGTLQFHNTWMTCNRWSISCFFTCFLAIHPLGDGAQASGVQLFLSIHNHVHNFPTGKDDTLDVSQCICKRPGTYIWYIHRDRADAMEIVLDVLQHVNRLYMGIVQALRGSCCTDFEDRARIVPIFKGSCMGSCTTVQKKCEAAYHFGPFSGSIHGLSWTLVSIWILPTLAYRVEGATGRNMGKKGSDKLTIAFWAFKNKEFLQDKAGQLLQSCLHTMRIFIRKHLWLTLLASGSLLAIFTFNQNSNFPKKAAMLTASAQCMLPKLLDPEYLFLEVSSFC